MILMHKPGTSSHPTVQREYLYAFLAKIIRHISLNRCRDRCRLKRNAYICELSTEMEQCIPAPDDCACRIDDMIFADVINRFLASLTVEKTQHLLRRYWYLDSIADISKRFGCSEWKVKTMLFYNQTQKNFEKIIKSQVEISDF